MRTVLAASSVGLLVLSSFAPTARAGGESPAGSGPESGRPSLDVPVSLAVAPNPANVFAFAPPPDAPRETPPVEVRGQTPPPAPVLQYPAGGGWSPTGLHEDTRLGPYGQPEWTTERQWARVRSYVIAPGQVEFESWYRGRYRRHGEGDRHIFQEEVGIGLPGRFQLDFYLNFEDNPDHDLQFTETQVELRWALANWDCIPWNPTLYFEYKIHDDQDEADVAEMKILFSRNLGCRWKAGFNLTYERELSGEEEQVFGATAAASYVVIDQRLSVGAEFQWESATVKDARDDYENTFYLGPSVQIRLSRNTHLDIAPLIGLNDDSNKMQLFIVFGIDIGGNGGDGGWLNPISAASR